MVYDTIFKYMPIICCFCSVLLPSRKSVLVAKVSLCTLNGMVEFKLLFQDNVSHSIRLYIFNSIHLKHKQHIHIATAVKTYQLSA